MTYIPSQLHIQDTKSHLVLEGISNQSFIKPIFILKYVHKPNLEYGQTYLMVIPMNRIPTCLLSICSL